MNTKVEIAKKNNGKDEINEDIQENGLSPTLEDRPEESPDSENKEEYYEPELPVEIELERYITQQTAKLACQYIKNCVELKQPIDLPIRLKSYTKDKYIQMLELVEGQTQQLVKEDEPVGYKPRGAKAYWITISPPAPYDNYHSLADLMAHYKKKYHFTALWCYTYEWRNHKTQTGCHVHLLLHKRDGVEINKDLQIFKPAKNKYLSHVGITEQNHKVAIKIKYVYNQNGIDIMTNYVQGNKKPTKMKGVGKDKLIRKQLGIHDYYTHIPLLK